MNQKEADNILMKFSVCLWFANAASMAVVAVRMKETNFAFFLLVMTWVFSFVAMYGFLKWLTYHFKQPK